MLIVENSMELNGLLKVFIGRSYSQLNHNDSSIVIKEKDLKELQARAKKQNNDLSDCDEVSIRFDDDLKKIICIIYNLGTKKIILVKPKIINDLNDKFFELVYRH